MYNVYQVVLGDSLETIANRFKITVQELKKINNLPNNYVLKAGEQLVVPMAEDSFFVNHTVQKGDNMYEIASKYNINVDELLQINGLKRDDYIYPGDTIIIPKADTRTYRTKNGDTLGGVAKDLNISIQELMRTNQTIYLLPNQLLIVQKK